MGPSGGSSAFADPEGIRRAARAPTGAEDEGLLSALDRLSASLDRIHALLGELHSRTERGERLARGASAESGGGQSSRPRVVYGGGPSAFVSREPGAGGHVGAQ